MEKKFLKNKWEVTKYLNIIVFCFFVITPLLFYGNLIFNNSIAVSGDGVLTLNLKSLLTEGIQSGDIPLWNRFVGIGTSYIGDIQNTFFYPINLLALFMNESMFVNVFYTLHISLAGFFMYLYINEIQESKIISFIVGIIFMFSSILGGRRREHINIISTVIWIPLILYYIEKFMQTKQRRYIIFIAIIMSIQFFAGFPQIALYSDICIFIYFVYLLFKEKIRLNLALKSLFLLIGLYILLIGVQLIPLIEMMMYSGRQEVPFEFFSVLSYDYKILPMLFFPYIYENIFQPFGEYASSGIDIEIYFGIICISYIIYAIPYIIKNKKFLFIFILTIGTFIFGAGAHIPIVNKLLWKTPIIGSFRVISRVMIISVILCLILFAISISYVNKQKKWDRVIKFNMLFIILLAICRLVITILIDSKNIETTVFSMQHPNNISYWLPIIMLCINLLVLIILNNSSKLQRIKGHILVVFIGIITISDVGRYSIAYNSKPIESFILADEDKTLQLLDNKNNELYRSWGAVVNTEDFYDEEFKLSKYNHNMMKEIMLINGYLTFNDPQLSSALGNVFYPNIQQILTHRNDLISMLAIKYIFDPWKNINDEAVVYGNPIKKVFEVGNLIVQENEELGVVQYPINLEKNKGYLVEFNVNTQEKPELFYLDLYGTNYDQAEQDMFITFDNKKQKYSMSIYTGNKELPTDLVFRVVTQGNKKINLSNISIRELGETDFRKVYDLVDEMNQLAYENKNVKPILYVPNKVYKVDDDSGLYLDFNYKDLDQISYIKDFKDMNLEGENTRISNIKIRHNVVTANVNTTKDTFINHAQTMYPGWKAYVDGKKVKIHLVNGIIQGIEVPKGEHTIEFKYQPVSLLIGSVMSSIGIMIIIWLGCIRKRVAERIATKIKS